MARPRRKAYADCALLRNDVDVVINACGGLRQGIERKEIRRARHHHGGSRSIPQLPDVPTARGAGVADFQVSSWNGLYAPVRNAAGRRCDAGQRRSPKSWRRKDIRQRHREPGPGGQPHTGRSACESGCARKRPAGARSSTSPASKRSSGNRYLRREEENWRKTFIGPHGKRICVSVSVMLEAWSEGKRAAVRRPGNRAQARRRRPRRHRLGQLRRQDRRLSPDQSPQEHSLSAARSASTADAAEIYPDAVARDRQSPGHDVAGHGYLQDKPMNGMTPEEEEATIKKCLDLLETTAGQRPEGWVSPSMAFSPAHRMSCSRRRGLEMARRRPRQRCAARHQPQARPDGAHSLERLHRQSRVALELDGPLGRLQGDVRLSLSRASPGGYLPISMHCQQRRPA